MKKKHVTEAIEKLIDKGIIYFDWLIERTVTDDVLIGCGINFAAKPVFPNLTIVDPMDH